MGDVVSFPGKKPIAKSANHMISLDIFRHPEGELEVSAEISDGNYTDYEIFEAIMAAAWKFAEDSDLVEDVEDDHD